MVFKVAIDGPSASGKSSIAKKAAELFDLVHINTGLMYRAVAYQALKESVSVNCENNLVDLIKRTELRLDKDEKVFINDEEISRFLRDEEISLAASTVSSHPLVRELLVSQQQAMSNDFDCIMDGRDIGTVVMPDADLKIYITADVEDRACRRQLEMKKKGIDLEFARVLEDMKKRDFQDMNRPVGPLKPADDAIQIDTTGNEFEKSLKIVATEIKKALASKKGRLT